MLSGWILLAARLATAAEVPAALEPCTAEVERLCADVAVGEGRLVGCLRAHDLELSEPCRTRVTGLIARRRNGPALGPQTMLACKTDLGTHCAGIASGGGRLRACLDQHAAQLAPRCTRALAAAAKAVDAKKAAAPPAAAPPAASR